MRRIRISIFCLPPMTMLPLIMHPVIMPVTYMPTTVQCKGLKELPLPNLP